MNISNAERIAQRETSQRDDLKARVLYLETQNAALEESLRVIALSKAKV